MDIVSVQRQYEKELLQLPNVTGVAIGKKGDEDVIVVYVTQKVSERTLTSDEIIPKTLNGFATDVREIGEVSSY